ncbi:MAG TPA: 3-oxoacyl-ACP synthase [Flavobacterium sp.]|jgi:hypothetical protein
MEQVKVISSCSIRNGEIILNDKPAFSSESPFFSDFSKKAYKHFGMEYPKFFRMDSLSKLAFLGAELLLKDEVKPDSENDIALVFSNRSSSLDTDIRHQDSISDRENYYPSPAVFVYTLANICMGEISIRHQLKSENSFFIFAAFNREFLFSYSKVLIETGKAEKVLCGWVDYLNDDYEAFLYLVGAEGQ